eukprot:6424474-Amphidinium_carterae.1
MKNYGVCGFHPFAKNRLDAEVFFTYVHACSAECYRPRIFVGSQKSEIPTTFGTSTLLLEVFNLGLVHGLIFLFFDHQDSFEAAWRPVPGVVLWLEKQHDRDDPLCERSRSSQSLRALDEANHAEEHCSVWGFSYTWKSALQLSLKLYSEIYKRAREGECPSFFSLLSL